MRYLAIGPAGCGAGSGEMPLLRLPDRPPGQRRSGLTKQVRVSPRGLCSGPRRSGGLGPSAEAGVSPPTNLPGQVSSPQGPGGLRLPTGRRIAGTRCLGGGRGRPRTPGHTGHRIILLSALGLPDWERGGGASQHPGLGGNFAFLLHGGVPHPLPHPLISHTSDICNSESDKDECWRPAAGRQRAQSSPGSKQVLKLLSSRNSPAKLIH